LVGLQPDNELAFAIDPQIDIHSRALLNMISDELEGDQQLPARAKTVAEGHDISIDEAGRLIGHNIIILFLTRAFVTNSVRNGFLTCY
jgi:hypothetical protein